MSDKVQTDPATTTDHKSIPGSSMPPPPPAPPITDPISIAVANTPPEFVTSMLPEVIDNSELMNFNSLTEQEQFVLACLISDHDCAVTAAEKIVNLDTHFSDEIIREIVKMAIDFGCSTDTARLGPKEFDGILEAMVGRGDLKSDRARAMRTRYEMTMQVAKHCGFTTENFEWWLGDTRQKNMAVDVCKICNETVYAIREGTDRPKALRDLAEGSARLLERSERASGNTQHQIYTEDDLDALPPTTWLVPGLIKDKSISMVFGAYGSAKSLLTLNLGLAVANGLDWLGRPCETGSVLSVSPEDFHEIHPRLRAWAKHHQIPRCKSRYCWIHDPVIFGKPVDVRSIISKCRTMAEPVRLLVVDTVAANWDSAVSENDSSAMAAFVAGLQKVIREIGCAVVVLHHTPLDRDDRPRGSGALGGAAFSMIGSKLVGESEVTVWCHKLRGAKRFSPIGMRLLSVPIGGEEEQPVLIMDEEVKVVEHRFTTSSVLPRERWSNTLPTEDIEYIVSEEIRVPKAPKVGRGRKGQREEKGEGVGRRQSKKKTQIERLIDHVRKNGSTNRGDDVVKEILPNRKVRSRKINEAVESGDLILDGEILSSPSEEIS